MRPPFGYEAQSYIRAAKPVEDLPSVDITNDLYEDDEITQPYTALDRSRLEILSPYDPNEDTLPSASFEPEASSWKGAVTGFSHHWGVSLVAAALILALAFESSCLK